MYEWRHRRILLTTYQPATWDQRFEPEPDPQQLPQTFCVDFYALHYWPKQSRATFVIIGEEHACALAYCVRTDVYPLLWHYCWWELRLIRSARILALACIYIGEEFGLAKLRRGSTPSWSAWSPLVQCIRLQLWRLRLGFWQIELKILRTLI